MLTKSFYQERIRTLKIRIKTLGYFLQKEKDPVRVQAIKDELAGTEYDIKKAESDSDFAPLNTI